MRIEHWLSWLRPNLRPSSGLPCVLALLAAGFFAPGHCVAQPTPDAPPNAAPASGVWVPTGKLNAARSGHTATLLPNGKVLVVGGQSADSPDAELYDPATGTWSITGRLNHSRDGYTTTLLPNGKVLVAGGWDRVSGLFTDTAELYDPDTGTWTLTGKLTSARWLHSAALLRNGKVLVMAGNVSDHMVTQCELYDPATGTWGLTNPLEFVQDYYKRYISGRDLPQATLLQDGRVLMTGGSFDVDLSYGMSNAELYDPGTGTWHHVQDLHTARLGHTATLLPSGNVLVTGGDTPPYPLDIYRPGPVVILPPYTTAELFNPATGTWSNAASLNVDRHALYTATLLPDGEVLVAGGYNSTDSSEKAELYDPIGARWRNTGDLNTARQSHTATLLRNGKVLVAGGGNLHGWLDSAELYDNGPVQVAIGAGFTGSWYDPTQSGHGFSIQVLPGSPQQMLAYWFTFAPQGGQSWIAALGPIDGSRAALQGVQTVGAGARFPPNFDAANARQESWGTLIFTFSDCNHGRVEWNATASGNGSGGMDLTRLTLPAGLTCSGDDSAGYWDY